MKKTVKKKQLTETLDILKPEEASDATDHRRLSIKLSHIETDTHRLLAPLKVSALPPIATEITITKSLSISPSVCHTAKHRIR